MSIHSRALVALRDVQDLLVNQFSDVNLMQLSTLSVHGNLTYERIALLMESISPPIAKFGMIVRESDDYIKRQRRSARQFRGLVTLLLCIVIPAGLLMTYVYANEPGPWTYQIVNALYVIIVSLFIIGFLHVILTAARMRIKLINDVPVGDINRFRINIADNIFIQYVNARLQGGDDGIKKFAKEIATKIQNDFDNYESYDFCGYDPKLPSADNLTCTVVSLCEPTTPNQTLADVLRGHFAKGVNTQCGQTLRSLFRALQDVKDGNKTTNMDQYSLWKQVAVGATVLKSIIVLRQDNASKRDLSDAKLLRIIKDDVIEVLKLKHVEVPDVEVTNGSPETEVGTADDKASCWKACYDKGDECRWAKFQYGKCTISSTPALPNVASSVFTVKHDVSTDNPTTVLVHANASDDKPTFVCSKGISQVAANALTPMVYAGSLTFDAAADANDTDVVALQNKFSSVSELVSQDVTAYKANRADDYKTLFGKDARGEEMYCRKTTSSQIVDINPSRIVQTYSELEPVLREKIATSMERHQYQVPLKQYRAIILNQLKDHYQSSFTSLAPYIIDTLDALENLIASSRKAIKANDTQYVTAQRLKDRIEGLTSHQRTLLTQIVSDMASAAYIHNRQFPPKQSDADLAVVRTIVVYGVMITFVSIIIVGFAFTSCYMDKQCSLETTLRSMVLVCCCIALALVVIMSSYKKTITRRAFNRNISDTNGQTLVSASNALLNAMTGGGGMFKAKITIATSRSGRIELSTSGGSKIIDLQSNIVKENLSTSSTDDNQDIRSIIVTADSIVGAKVLNVRAIRVVDVQSGLAHTFRSNNGPATLTKGGSIELPLRSSTTFVKATRPETRTFDVQVFMVDNVQDYAAVLLYAKRVITAFDSCNAISDGMRKVPFPTIDVMLNLVGIAVVVFIVIYMLGVLDPHGKFRNIAQLINAKRRVKMGELIPELTSLISCCDTLDSTWERITTFAVLVFLIITLILTITAPNAVADYRGGLYSSDAYAENKCV